MRPEQTFEGQALEQEQAYLDSMRPVVIRGEWCRRPEKRNDMALLETRERDRAVMLDKGAVLLACVALGIEVKREASPDLLALLIQLRDGWFEPLYGLSDSGSQAVRFLEAIRSAIAKAEGR